MQIVTVGTHKGGVGKTNISFHLAHYACENGYNVLLIDLDVQANSSFMLLGDNYSEISRDHLVSSMLFQNSFTTQHKPFDIHSNFQCISSDEKLLAIERLPLEAATNFKNNLSELSSNFDLVVIDTPPTMGFAMLSPLMASHALIAPIIPDQFSIQGIRSMHTKVASIQNQYNRKLKFAGLLINQYQKRNRLHQATVKQLNQLLPDLMIQETIAWRSAIANSSYQKKPVWDKPKGGAARTAAQEMRNAMKAICARVMEQ